MGKTTNKLVDLAKEISVNPDKRELDVLLSTGEQISISLLAIAIQSLGYDAISFTGYQAGIRTKGIHSKSEIESIDIDRIKENLEQGKIVIVAGFQGINESGDITTLGRGGSDTTAVALAASLGCNCIIYTDVEGIYPVDPKLYPNAKNRLHRVQRDDRNVKARCWSNGNYFGGNRLQKKCTYICNFK